MQKTELITLAEEILAVNPQCAISGSLALNIQNIRTKNTPGDIDIYVPKDIIFVPTTKMVENFDFNRDDYRNDEYERIQYYSGTVKIDVFKPTELNTFELITVDHNTLKVVRFEEIIKFKIRFAFDDHSSAEKHKQDVLYIVQQANNFTPVNIEDII